VDKSAQNILEGGNFPWILPGSLLCLIFRHISNMLFFIDLICSTWQIPDFHEGIATVA
jgi:hypothetical protein